MSVTQTFVGGLDGEGALQVVRSDDGRTACNGPGLLVAAYGLDAVLSHEAFDTVEAADLADFSQVPEDATRTINAMTCPVGISDKIEQAGIFLGVIAHGLLEP